MKPTKRRRTGGHVRPAGWHGLQSFGRPTRLPSGRQSTGRHNFEIWLLRGQCRKCDIHRPTVLTKYLWEYYYTLLYISLCQVHRCLFTYARAVKFAHRPIWSSPTWAIQYKIALGLYTFEIYTSIHSTIRPYGISIPNVIMSSQPHAAYFFVLVIAIEFFDE